LIDWPPVLILEELDIPLLGEWVKGVAIFKVPQTFVWEHDAVMWVDADLQNKKFALSVTVNPLALYTVLEGDFIQVTLNFDLNFSKEKL
jgi:hypothetical protein